MNSERDKCAILWMEMSGRSSRIGNQTMLAHPMSFWRQSPSLSARLRDGRTSGDGWSDAWRSAIVIFLFSLS